MVSLDNCWGHHQDGSDLLVDQHVLFDVTYNTVIDKIRNVLQSIDEATGDTKEKWCKEECTSRKNDTTYFWCDNCPKVFQNVRKLMQEK